MARHRDLPHHNLLAVAQEWRAGHWQIRKRLPLVLETAEILEGPFERANAAVELPSLRSEDSVEVKVVHPAIGELYSVQETIGALIPEAERNVLWEALKYFCSEPNLTEMLVRPYEHKAKRLKESAAFELYVAWLLGLWGSRPWYWVSTSSCWPSTRTCSGEVLTSWLPFSKKNYPRVLQAGSYKEDVVIAVTRH
jgi:hypothetical protein